MTSRDLRKTAPAAARRAQRGMTLVELMVGATLGMVVALALVVLYANVTRSSAEMARANLQIENGRAALMLLQQDVSHAGFWGGFVPDFDNLTLVTAPADAPVNVPDVCLAYSSLAWNAAYQQDLMGVPVQSYESVPTSCASVLPNKKANTDILVVRHLNNCVAGAANCEADVAGSLYFVASRCDTQIAAPPAYVLDTAGFSTMLQRDCATPVTDKRKYISSIYYIRDYATTVGDGIPTLVRSRFDLSGGTLAHQAAQPLVEGIEGFVVEWGIDSLSETGAAADYTTAVTWGDATRNIPTNRGDGVADGAFVRCTDGTPCTVAQLSNAVSARIHVLARSIDYAPGYTDGKTYTLGSTTLGPFTGADSHYKRHAFSGVVRLVNISGRRETP